MKLAVIQTGGKQYVVKEGDVVIVEKISDEVKKDDTVTFDQVLLADDGKTVQVGTPTLKAEVSATVVEAGRAKKVEVVRYKSKSRYLKRRGHRQPFTKVKIASL